MSTDTAPIYPDQARVISPAAHRCSNLDILERMLTASAKLRDEEARQTSLLCQAHESYLRLTNEGEKRNRWGEISSIALDASRLAAEAVRAESVTMISQQWLYHGGWKSEDWGVTTLTSLYEERTACATYRASSKDDPAVINYALIHKYNLWTRRRIEDIGKEAATIQQLEEFGAQLRDENLNFDMLEGSEDTVAVRCLAVFYRNLLLGKKPT